MQHEQNCFQDVSKMRVLDLFSGIGGFSLGLERTCGFRTIAFCEIEEFPRKVLRKHWPNVPVFEDVRKLHATDITEPIDVICGGYPCQPFSLAGKRQGADDDRHLWPEIARLLRELDAAGNKPTWCVFENVAGHVNMGLDQVLAELESQGYTAWPVIVPACSVDAPHRRDRVWIICNSERGGLSRNNRRWSGPQLENGCTNVSDTARHLFNGFRNIGPSRGHESANSGGDATHSSSDGLQRGKHEITGEGAVPGRRRLANKNIERGCKWPTEPGVGRVAHGISRRVDRLKSLGNSVVPQVVEIIGRAILEAER